MLVMGLAPGTVLGTHKTTGMNVQVACTLGGEASPLPAAPRGSGFSRAVIPGPKCPGQKDRDNARHLRDSCPGRHLTHSRD